MERNGPWRGFSGLAASGTWIRESQIRNRQCPGGLASSRLVIPEQLLLLQGGQQVGPFPKDSVQGMLEAGSVLPSDYVWGEGMAEWVSLDTLFPGVGPVPQTAVATAGSQESKETGKRGPGFGSLVSDALSYPFRGDGVIILIAGTLVFTVLNFVGRYSFFLSLATWGYLLLMLQQIVQTSSQGETRPPTWPDFDGFGEVLMKTSQWLVAILLCFGPGFFLIFSSRDGESMGRAVFGLVALFAGALYLPMSLLGIAMFDSVNALHPMLVVRSIARIPGHYALTLIVLVLLGGVKALTGQLGDLPGALGIVGHFVDEFDGLWSAFFSARLLGGLYHLNHRRLGWF